MRFTFLAVLLAAALGIGLPVDAANQNPAPAASAARPAAVVNLNTATVAQLTTLPGIGARTAALIVEYREKNGPFKKSEDLMNVKGIGEKSFLKLRNLITVTAPKAVSQTQP